ncbi:protein takeout-like [Teleopsis dalmanni]|uniref:protein takeout-like n=1 Tax=Teleopsis dalmanni TaxID=139649 RepID=UPI0018CD7E21|nr:protein takeout-like [Teleopsis dalmanni]
MFKIVLNTIVCFIFFSTINAANVLPQDMQKCANSDESCLTKTGQMIVTNYAKSGLRELNLTPFDPLHIKSMVLEKNPASPVNIELSFNDVNLNGLQNLKIKKLKGLDANLKEITEVEAEVPSLSLEGPYSINGKVLVLPIVGKGDCKIILDNTHIAAKIKLKPVQKSGKTYAEVESIKLELSPKHVSFSLSGLFNNDKQLSDTMHTLLNENWSEIFNELKPEISKALGLIIKLIINNVFAKYPYEEYFA